MTVFEQHVDLHQVATEPTLLGFALITLVGAIVFSVSVYLTIKFAKGNISDLIGIGLTLFATAFSVGMAIPLTANNSVTATPAAPNGLSNKSDERPLLADKYREEINAGIADKLGDYTIDNVTIDNDTVDSVLTGGYSDGDITAHRDGKNYRLRPEWDFDKSTSTVKITVDVEELPFNRTDKE